MPDFGYVAFCIRPDCEWIAVRVNAQGEDEDVQLFDQPGALAAVDDHLRAAHTRRPLADGADEIADPRDYAA